VNEHRGLYERNGEAVKQHLIGEIFQALGWKWDNPKEVRPEEGLKREELICSNS